MKRISVVLFLIFNCSIANAKWSALGTINNIYSHNGFHIVETTIQEQMCGNNGKFYWPSKTNEFEDAKDMLSISLAALMSQKRVRFVFNENQAICQSGATLATHMMISKE